MSLSSHLQELRKKHQSLSEEVEAAQRELGRWAATCMQACHKVACNRKQGASAIWPIADS